jgi:cellulase/cellobiase CelA1
VVAGESFALPILWTDPESDAVTPSVLEQPAGSSFDTATGWFTWTPTPADVGTHRLLLYAEDDNPAPRSVTAEVTIEVLPPELGLVAISVFEDWGAGYCADLSWTNNIGVDLEGWTLRLGLDPATTVLATWNGQFTAEASGYTIEPVDYNRVVLSGETLVVGFCADGPAPLWAEIIGPETITPDVTLLYTEWGSWAGSACGDVHIINRDTVLIDGWMVSWGLPTGTTLGSSWRANVSFSGDRYIALDDGWNAEIAPDSEQVFGFCTLGTGSPEALAFALR